MHYTKPGFLIALASSLLLISCICIYVFQENKAAEYSPGNQYLNWGHGETVQRLPDPHVPEKSGPIYTGRLLWENEAGFLQMQKEYGTYTRMSAFKTVLPDPLPGEEENVSIAADKISGTVLLPEEVFSQNAAAGPYTRAKGYKDGPTYSGGQVITTTGGGVCKIATTLYNVAILSNLRIVERHPHSMIVPYVPPGQDATVYYGSRDIKFMNDTRFPIMLWARSRDKVLYMAIYGQSEPAKVTWHHKTLYEQDTYDIYKKNPELPEGTQRVVMDGYKGYKVESWITIQMPDGSLKTKNLGISVYSPMPRIVEIGTQES